MERVIAFELLVMIALASLMLIASCALLVIDVVRREIKRWRSSSRW